MTAPSAAALIEACEALSECDPALARAYAEIGLPNWRAAKPEYRSLARSVVYQQISTKAAGAIWERVLGAYPNMEPYSLFEATEDHLRALGLSRPKIRHLQSIAEAILTDKLNFDRLCASDGNAARAELIAVKGIGPWTAELFCLYALGDMNAFPTADLGLMESYRQLRNDKERLDRSGFEAAGEAWRPWRGCAAHLLWDWLNFQRSKAETA